ncbi:MAG: large conductance mechanosensitive channel protein MscL [Acidaminococcus intestini]|uniref:Large-conductance mechanosensitive channel n=1 Tax=Acidaminococcus intestini TaxID=187327 RepID=A0A943EHW8_9FIRM|nr:large conductance mechanosensitive channel protein MscL [Acidaminococcus intestini]
MMSSFLNDFKAFALRGNVVDMAVGVIIGGAFGKIVASFVSDIIMPPIGMILGGVDFSNLFINLSSKKVDTLAKATAAKVPVIAYGKFITTVIDFLIMAFVIFLMISLLNRFKKEEPAPETLCPFCKMPIDPAATKCPHCTSDIPKDSH